MGNASALPEAVGKAWDVTPELSDIKYSHVLERDRQNFDKDMGFVRLTGKSTEGQI
jgi:hypothetical protein